MQTKPAAPISLCADHARLAVQEWLETQSRVTGYWRDLLLSAGGSEDLIAVLDDHASFLAAAAHLRSAQIHRPQ
jgi:hypothetical protein